MTRTYDVGYVEALEFELRKLLREKYRNNTGTDYCTFVIGDKPSIEYRDYSQAVMPVIQPKTYHIQVNTKEI